MISLIANTIPRMTLPRRRNKFESSDPSNLGFPSNGPPLLGNTSPQDWERWIDQLAQVHHPVPRLKTDTAKSCPCKIKELYEYISLEESGFTPEEAPDVLKDFRFIRTGMILGHAIWLWKYTTPEVEARIAAVTFIEQSVMSVESLPPILNDDQLLLFSFLRALDGVLVREGTSWRVADKDEAAKNRAASWGSRSDAIPDAGLPDIIALRRGITRYFGKDDSPYNAAFSQINHAVPLLPENTPESAPYSLEKIRERVMYFNRDALNETPQQRQDIVNRYNRGEFPEAFEFVRTGHVIDLLVWIWNYRCECGTMSRIVVTQQNDKFAIHEARAYASLSSDQLCLLYFAHTLANQEKRLVRTVDHWEVHPITPDLLREKTP